jgi:hypothetical protein
MIYTVKIKGIKNHTSEHKVVAESPDDAIDLVLGRVPFDVSEVWCEDIYEIL